MMAHHWSLPLALGSGQSARHGCHWCSFEAKELHLVSAHIEADHKMKSRAGPDLPSHQCPLCPFEDNVKSKVTRHMMSCQKRFVADRNLEPPLDWEPPAKIPRMPTRGLRAFPGGMNAAAASLHGYSLASTKGLGLPYHPLLPKSALINTLGYNSVLPSATTGKLPCPCFVFRSLFKLLYLYFRRRSKRLLRQFTIGDSGQKWQRKYLFTGSSCWFALAGRIARCIRCGSAQCWGNVRVSSESSRLSPAGV